MISYMDALLTKTVRHTLQKNALMMFIIFAIPKTLDYAPNALVFGR